MVAVWCSWLSHCLCIFWAGLCKHVWPGCSFPECVCNYLGTVQERCNGSDCQCDKTTGQCLCLPNVIGQNCDRCAPNTWQLASGTGCDPCNCDAAHSFGPSCNEVRPCPQGSHHSIRKEDVGSTWQLLGGWAPVRERPPCLWLQPCTRTHSTDWISALTCPRGPGQCNVQSPHWIPPGTAAQDPSSRAAAHFLMDQGGRGFQYLAAESDFFFLATQPEVGRITIASIVESSPVPWHTQNSGSHTVTGGPGLCVMYEIRVRKHVNKREHALGLPNPTCRGAIRRCQSGALSTHNRGEVPCSRAGR